MKQLIEFSLEDGGTMLVQVDEPAPEGGVVRAARPGEIVAKASQTFESALDKIKPAAGAIIAKLRGLADPPDEIEVEFGLTLNAEAGAFVAAAGAEANYTVKLTWKREASEQDSETQSRRIKRRISRPRRTRRA
jgi:hypothetical protein